MPPDATTTATTDATTTATTTAATSASPWHAGLDAELIGWGQNKGWKIDDPKEAFAAAAKQAREAEKHFSVPPDQLLKLPKADAKPEEITAFWSKLGTPGEAKDYDFSAVKDSAGNPIAPSLADAIRAAAFAAHAPKDVAAAVAQAAVKQLDSERAAQVTTDTAKLAAEKDALKKNWGTNWDFNHLKAMDGARRLGLRLDPNDTSPEGVADKQAVANLEKNFGYARTMDLFRRIGVSTSEDTFVERGAGSGGTPATREGAIARRAELMADQAWGKRYVSGGAEEKREMDALNLLIDGMAA